MVAAVQAAQAVKEVTQITEQHSLQLTRNLLRIAIFHISYIRGLFPEEYFRDTNVQSLDMKVKKLLPMDLESRRLIDWMEKGVYDALKKKYLKTMLFTLCEGDYGPTIEEYSFSFDYSTTSEEVFSVHVAKNGRHKKTLKTGGAAEANHEQMRKSACKMMRTLVTLMRTLDGVPNEPEEYEPPFFRSCTFDEKRSWRQPPFRMKAGEVNSRYFTFSLKVKSTLDPCEDEIDQNSTGVPPSSGASETSSDSANSDGRDQYGKLGIEDDADNCTYTKFTKDTAHSLEEDEMTQDLEQETSNMENVKKWLISRTMVTIHITDLLANFPEISEQHTEDLLSRMVKEGFLIDLGKDKYKINRRSQSDDQVDDYYEAEKGQPPADKDQAVTQEGIKREDSMYLKALYYALPLEYVTIPQLQTKLGDEVNHLATRKLIEKMVNEGYVEGTAANRRIGRRVIHSEQAHKKLQELHEALNPGRSLSQEMEKAAEGGKLVPHTPASNAQHQLKKLQPQAQTASPKDWHNLLPQVPPATEDMDGSTCGGLHSFGSDLTRHVLASPLNHAHKAEDTASPAGPKMSKRTLSRESHLNSNVDAGILSPLRQKEWSKRGFEFRDSQETCDKDLRRKASMVEEPIYQAEKRLRRDTR